MIVDDENLALRKMEKLLLSQEGFDVNFELIGTFQNPYDALEAARQEVPDVAFLDIEMPEITGFELAERLLELHPQMQVVFVTAYQDFAIKAFEVNALDYLLKPVHPARLAVTLNRVAQFASMNAAGASGTAQKHTKLCLLQSLHYRDQEDQPQNFPWKTLKAPELFAYLIYYRDKTVSKQTLMDLLWPDHDLKKATTQLHTAIYQIRKMIKTCGLDVKISYHDEGYRLVRGTLKLDVEEWENSLRGAPDVTLETLSRHVAIMKKYTGDFLEEHRYFWAEPEQERTRLLWLEHAKLIASCHMELGQHSEAARIYHEIMVRLPYLEDGYAGLIKMYAELHHQVEVKRVFHQLTEVLFEEYGISPSKEITEWYQHWEQGISSCS
ncbi:response regulator [Paenibacillus sp.]|jgi:two-component SAPR family response regulator|uniref:response regulator n=1 Tax=Paenibacillus sp. TaxID=58172 RepID=UPI00282898C5|nr:response regulator [Paenibacillus sp.]MDR0268097.1 response regulator [Paenibacillus sp.]